MARAIEAVLFDFGGVFTASPFRVFDEAGVELGARPGQIESIVFGPYPEDTDHSWHRLERGEISLEVAQAEIRAEGARQGLHFDPLEILFRMGGRGGGLREAFVERARALRSEGYRTALVTNNVAEFSEAWRRMVPVDELFELVVDSSQVGLRKPNPAIFHLALERLGGIAPERSVFLDDFAGNVHAAAGIGMHGIVVEDEPASALAQLERLLAD